MLRLWFELRVDVIIGSDDLLAAEFYRPIGRKGLFALAQSSQRSPSIFTEDHVAGVQATQISRCYRYRVYFNRRTQLRLYLVGRDDAKVSIGDPLLPKVAGLLRRPESSLFTTVMTMRWSQREERVLVQKDAGSSRRLERWKRFRRLRCAPLRSSV